MKKIQVILASAALLLAVAGVFANTLVTYQYYLGQPNLSGVACITPTTPPPAPCETGSAQCFKDIASEGGTNRFYISKRAVDAQGVPVGNCLIVPRP